MSVPPPPPSREELLAEMRRANESQERFRRVAVGVKLGIFGSVILYGLLAIMTGHALDVSPWLLVIGGGVLGGGVGWWLSSRER